MVPIAMYLPASPIVDSFSSSTREPMSDVYPTQMPQFSSTYDDSQATTLPYTPPVPGSAMLQYQTPDTTSVSYTTPRSPDLQQSNRGSPSSDAGGSGTVPVEQHSTA